MSHHDPFDTAREEVTEKLRVASALHEVYLEQLSASNTDPFALKDISSQLQKEVKGVEWFVSDLEETIFIVEKDPLKFGIDQNEMKNRKNFIKNTKDTIKVCALNIFNKVENKRRHEPKTKTTVE
jgi:syntaxin 6